MGERIEQLQAVVAGIERAMEAQPHKIQYAALGVVLTKFIAAHPIKDRERVLELLIKGVREDAPAFARELHKFIAVGQWH